MNMRIFNDNSELHTSVTNRGNMAMDPALCIRRFFRGRLVRRVNAYK